MAHTKSCLISARLRGYDYSREYKLVATKDKFEEFLFLVKIWLSDMWKLLYMFAFPCVCLNYALVELAIKVVAGKMIESVLW